MQKSKEGLFWNSIWSYTILKILNLIYDLNLNWYFFLLVLDTTH